MRGVVCAAALALVCVVGSCAVGCGVTSGYSLERAYTSDVRTVAVPVWDNATFSTGLEVQLTEAIVKEIQRTTPWRVTSGASADTSLTGSITDVSLRELSSTRGTGLTEEQLVSMTVEFEWRDSRSGQLLTSREDFTAGGTFVPAPSSRERIEVGEYGAIAQLARDVVRSLRSAW